MDVNYSRTALSPLKVRVRQLQHVKELDDYQISPSSPLLSTAIDDNGWVCGRNDCGQLGVGGRVNLSQPHSLQAARRWAALSFGEYHAAGVSGNGEVYTWGLNESGQLGYEAEAGSDVPRKVEALSCLNIRAVACGAEHTVALAGQEVIAWGSNLYGQCGIGDHPSMRIIPTPIKNIPGVMVTQIVCGTHHTLCVTATSQVLAWGCNSVGQLGVGDFMDRNTPTLVTELWAMPVQQLAAGDAHSAALTSNGFLFTWGLNSKGQLGLPPTADVAAQVQAHRTNSEKMRVRRRVNQRFLTAMVEMGIPRDKAELALIETGNVGVEIAAEWYFSIDEETWDNLLESDPSTPVKEDDCVEISVARPKRVPLQGVQYVAAGGEHTVAVTDATVYSWGNNASGQLGLGHANSLNQPAEITELQGKHIRQVACGNSHTLFLSSDSAVYGCGSMEFGQLPLFDSRLSVPASRTISRPTKLNLNFLYRHPKGNHAVVSALAAGGHATGLLTRGHNELPDDPPMRLLERLHLAISRAFYDLGRISNHSSEKELEEAQKNFKSIQVAIRLVFSSAAALSAAFGYKDKVGIDVQQLEDFQQKIFSLQEQLANTEILFMECALGDILIIALFKATEHLLDDLQRSVRLLCTPERAQVLLAATQSPLIGRADFARLLIPRLCSTILSAPSSTRHLLLKWWAEYPADLLANRVVDPLQRYLTSELYATKKLTINVMNVIKVLAKVEEANQLGRNLPPDAFYNELISEKLDVYDHYIAWRQTHDMPQHSITGEGPFSFCSYPFLLNPRAKSKLLHTEARLHMDQTIQASRQEMLQGNATPPRRAIDERVLPYKRRPDEENRCSSRSSDYTAGQQNNRRPRRQEANRTGLRSLLFNMLRNNNEEDNARLPEQAAATGGLIRHGSMNLPPPERSGVPATHPDMCILRIRRTHLIEDALDEIARQNPRDLHKPLRVVFIGEDGIDAGGVKKEFFQLLVEQLLCPDYGMLVYMPESRTFWFNPMSLDVEAEFMLIGLVLGLAIYNAVILDFPLPLALYKKLLGQQVTVRDLEDMQPMLGRSLKQLITYEGPGSVEDVFCQTFSVEVPAFGEVRVIPLKENGESTPVTEDNRQEFIDCYVDFWLNTSIHQQFEAFAKGFLMLCGGPALHLFNATELERLVCGNPILDFIALEKSAKYEGGYHAQHRAVRWLWDIVHELDDVEKRKFLKFFTGSDRAPIGGLGNLKCIIQRDGPDGNKLPTSHTCFNTLLLPSYKSKEKMGERLRLAIMNAEGFGLE